MAKPENQKKMPPLTRNQEMTHAINELASETDRGVAIVGGAMLDTAMEYCLLARLRQPSEQQELTARVIEHLLGQNGVLGPFSARFNLAYLMQIIGPVALSEIRTINSIRNLFAHSASGITPQNEIAKLQFSHPTIAQKVQSLTEREAAIQPHRIEVEKTADGLKTKMTFVTDPHRLRFTHSVVWYWAFLNEDHQMYPTRKAANPHLML
jgi:hypothetical protein